MKKRYLPLNFNQKESIMISKIIEWFKSLFGKQVAPKKKAPAKKKAGGGRGRPRKNTKQK